jgi:hypothetical protein
LFSPYLPAATSWGALDRGLRALAPQVGFAAAQISRGSCRLIHGLSADRPRPLGSAFKLYVLGALGHAIADHHARWNERLRIRNAWKSLPSGVLQNAPAATALTLREFADLMISISDNTAADHLLHHLGRPAVERELGRLGNQHAGLDIPFPTTRELFALKGVDYRVVRLADGYLSRLRGGIALDRRSYPTVWFKGGSQPGVLTLTYLVRTADRRTFVDALTLADPAHPIPAAATAKLLALARSGITLAARH